ncbi:DUF3047 domain-containing protein [bacterium]|nr:DUF3047 domain-containing protein [bacterium]NUN44131.1 DUF3047 domain-containing protein [bacterium]
MSYIRRVLFILLCFQASLFAQAQVSTDALKSQLTSLRELLRDTARFRSTHAPVLMDQLMDWNEITRRKFEANWVNLTKSWQLRFERAIRQRLSEVFTQYLIHNAATLRRAESRWFDEEIGITRAKASLEIVQNQEIVRIALRLSFSENRWRIYDIRTPEFRLLRDLLPDCDEKISDGYSNEYVEALITNAEHFVIDDFNAVESGVFPRNWGWRKRDDDLMRSSQRVYSVVKDSQDSYLSAIARGTSVALVRPYSYDLREYPVLKWKWRVNTMPPASSQNDAIENAASVTVIFYQNWLGVPITITYAWAYEGGTCTTVKTSGWLYDNFSIVLRNAQSPHGQWIEETINLREDYKRIFGEYPPDQIAGLYIITDSPNFQFPTTADYDHIRAQKSTTTYSCRN